MNLEQSKESSKTIESKESKKEFQSFDYKKFIYIDKELNVNIEVKHFKKMKDYTNFIQYLIYIIENIIKLKEQQNNSVNPVNTINLINNIEVFVDLKHYKIREIDYTLIKMIIKFFEEKYPDNLRTLTLKNANVMFKTIYSIIRPFISKDTREKIFFESKKNKKIKEQEIEKMFD